MYRSWHTLTPVHTGWHLTRCPRGSQESSHTHGVGTRFKSCGTHTRCPRGSLLVWHAHGVHPGQFRAARLHSVHSVHTQKYGPSNCNHQHLIACSCACTEERQAGNDADHRLDAMPFAHVSPRARPCLLVRVERCPSGLGLDPLAFLPKPNSQVHPLHPGEARRCLFQPDQPARLFVGARAESAGVLNSTPVCRPSRV